MILILAPFRVVDTIDPLLRLKDNTAILLNKGVIPVRTVLLAGFDGNGAVLTDAGVDLHALLVGADIHLNARCRGGEAKNKEIISFRRGIARAVNYEGVIDACAVRAAELGIC